MKIIVFALIALFVGLSSSLGSTLLSAGRPCAFSPVSNYAPTLEGNSDAADLTDGRLTERSDQHMWFEPHSVVWSYQQVINLRVDLGQVQPIDEAVIRLQGGTPLSGIDFPVFVKIVVSDDDVTYHEVGQYSRWQRGDEEKYAIPATEGKAWVHPLRFADLKTRGRYVGFVIGGTSFTCSDELYVYGGDHDPAGVTFDPAQAIDFSVTRPQIAFVKPSLVVTSNIATPQPIVLLDSSGVRRDVTLNVEAPDGLEILAGSILQTKVADATREKLADGRTRHALSSVATGQPFWPWGRLYMQAKPNGIASDQQYLRCWLKWDGGESRPVDIPFTVAEIPAAPQIKRMTMALGWWRIAETRTWPDGIQAAKIIGLNTLSTFSNEMKSDDSELWAYADHARRQGFKMLNVDSTFHEIEWRHRDLKEFFCQFADGTTGASFCPSYRGPLYAQEIKRISDECARLKPDYLSIDTELWGWEGPKDPEKCTRCQADKTRLKIEDWAQWKLEKGYEMWKDVHDSVQQAVKQSGGGPVEMGLYDARPGQSYQFFWPFDRLYKEGLMNNSQASIYSPLRAYHIEQMGDEAREDRSKLQRTEGLPWLSPGDAGAFTAETLRCAMLEYFLNGSRGVHFWSDRYWDGEYFLGYNQAVRAVASVEDIIMDGELYDGAEVQKPARVSGMIRGKDIALLVGEYHGVDPVAVNVTLKAPVAGDVLDAESGQKLCEIGEGKQTLTVNLDQHRSRVLLIKAR